MPYVIHKVEYKKLGKAGKAGRRLGRKVDKELRETHAKRQKVEKAGSFVIGTSKTGIFGSKKSKRKAGKGGWV
jgi:ribosomal protein L37AE/L43A